MELLRTADVSSHVYLQLEGELCVPAQKILDVAHAYIPAFANSEWREEHDLDRVVYRMVYDLTIGPYGSLSTIERRDGTIVAAGWEGGGLLTHKDMFDWVITSYEMTEGKMFPQEKYQQVETNVLKYLEEHDISPQQIMNVPDFFVLPEERYNKFHTAKLMGTMTVSAYEHGITHYLVWTKHDSTMHDMMVNRKAEIIDVFNDGEEEHIIFGPLENLIGSYLKRKGRDTVNGAS